MGAFGVKMGRSIICNKITKMSLPSDFWGNSIPSRFIVKGWCQYSDQTDDCKLEFPFLLSYSRAFIASPKENPIQSIHFLIVFTQ